MASTQFELVTPTRTLFSGEAEMIVCRTVEGEIAFLANHMPYIGALDTGLVRIVGPVSGGGGSGAAGGGGGGASVGSEPEVRLAVRGGFVEVKDNQVIMLANAAELGGEIDVQAVRRAESEATDALSSHTGEDRPKDAEDALRWAQARLEAASAGGH